MSKVVTALAAVFFGFFCAVSLAVAGNEKDPVVAKYKSKLEYAKKQYMVAVDKIKQAMVKDYQRLRDSAMARKDLVLANKYQLKIDVLTGKVGAVDGAAESESVEDGSGMDLDAGIPVDPDASPSSAWKSLDNGEIVDENGITRLSQKKRGSPGRVYISKNLGNSYTVSGSFKSSEGGHFSFIICDPEKHVFVMCSPIRSGTMLLAQFKEGDKRREKLALSKFDWGDMGEWRDFTLAKRGGRLTLTIGKAKVSIKLKGYKMPFFGLAVYSKAVVELKGVNVSK